MNEKKNKKYSNVECLLDINSIEMLEFNT